MPLEAVEKNAGLHFFGRLRRGSDGGSTLGFARKPQGLCDATRCLLPSGFQQRAKL